MQNLQSLTDTLVKVYKEGRKALEDDKIKPGELFQILLQAGGAAAVDFNALPDEWNNAATADQFAIVTQVETALEGDTNKDFISGVFMMILGAGKFKK